MANESVLVTDLELVKKATRDIAKASVSLSRDEARFLVDTYYSIQGTRVGTGNRDIALRKFDKPHAMVAHIADQSRVIEHTIVSALTKYAGAHPLGIWAQEIVGIGPIISAGLLAYVDLEEADTAGAVWRFAGLDPTSRWLGEKDATELVSGVAGRAKLTEEHVVEIAKRMNLTPEVLRKRMTIDGEYKFDRTNLKKALKKCPHCAGFKVLCWKIGESFVKVNSNKNDIYGKVYLQRKAYEHEKNDRGDYKDQAAAMLARVPDHAQGKIYAEGKLPDGHLHSRAKRYAVKLFLAHYWETGRRMLDLPVPAPYPIAHLGHAHKIEPPIDGKIEAAAG